MEDNSDEQRENLSTTFTDRDLRDFFNISHGPDDLELLPMRPMKYSASGMQHPPTVIEGSASHCQDPECNVPFCVGGALEWNGKEWVTGPNQKYLDDVMRRRTEIKATEDRLLKLNAVMESATSGKSGFIRTLGRLNLWTFGFLTGALDSAVARARDLQALQLELAEVLKKMVELQKENQGLLNLIHDHTDEKARMMVERHQLDQEKTEHSEAVLQYREARFRDPKTILALDKLRMLRYRLPPNRRDLIPTPEALIRDLDAPVRVEEEAFYNRIEKILESAGMVVSNTARNSTYDPRLSNASSSNGGKLNNPFETNSEDEG